MTPVRSRYLSGNRTQEDDVTTHVKKVVFNPALLAKAVFAGMRERKWGRIVNIGSVNGQGGQIGQVNYAAAKSGIHGFTKSLARELATKSIMVNALAPLAATPMTETIRTNEKFAANMMNYWGEVGTGRVSPTVFNSVTALSFAAQPKAPVIGRVMLEATAGLDYDAVGGLTLGADPVATALLHAAAALVALVVVDLDLEFRLNEGRGHVSSPLRSRRPRRARL